MFSFTVISDTHYYSPGLGTSGRAYDIIKGKSQKLLKESAGLLRAAFSQLAKDDASDVILITGDLTNDGELICHYEFIKMLRELKAAGKKIYAITATHDYKESGETDGCDGDDFIKVPAARRAELFDMYREFGPDEAMAVHMPSMSYIVQLPDNCRLFALNDDTNLNHRSGFSDECFEWICDRLAEAKRDGQQVIAMTHHPMTAPNAIYEIVGKSDMSADCEKHLDSFADAGIGFILTGHTHMHDISCHFSKNGNCIYDITTSALCGYPGVMRRITVDRQRGTLNVSSLFVTEPVDFDLCGKNLSEYLENQLVGVVREMIAASSQSIEKLADMVTAISISPKVIYKYGWLIKPAAKLFLKLKIGSAARISRAETGLKQEDYADIADVPLTEFILSLAVHAFGGDAPYTPDTAYYKISVGLLNIADSFFKAARFNPVARFTGKAGAREFFEPLLHNTGIPDSGAVLPLCPTREQVEALCGRAGDDAVKESKKGALILTTLIFILLLTIPLLPLLAVVLLAGAAINRVRFHKKFRYFRRLERRIKAELANEESI